MFENMKGLLTRQNSKMDSYTLYSIDTCESSGKLYNGAEPKFGIVFNDSPYLVKRQKKNWNNVKCEYIASNIIKALGGSVHDTYLATYKGELVVLCKDFTVELGELKVVTSISESSIDTDISKHDYFYDDVIYEISKLVHGNIDDIMWGFNKMYVYDTILANPDRHIGNWGLVKVDGVYKFSPIIDNGASLFPRANIININKDWLQERIFIFPNSKIMFGNKRERSSYYQVWTNNMLPSELVEWARSLDVSRAIHWIVNNPLLSEQEKYFYSTIIYQRFKVIICGEEYVWR